MAAKGAAAAVACPYTYAVNQEIWVFDSSSTWVLGSVQSIDGTKISVKKKDGGSVDCTTSEKEVLPRNPPDLADVDNLMKHEFLHQASLLETLAIRYDRGCIYTYSGPVLISINPYRTLDVYGPDHIQSYHKGNLEKEVPHVYAIAEGSYRQLTREKKNQSILITGESGAGKTEATKLMLKYLAVVATREADIVMSDNMNPLMRMKRVEQQIIDSSPITEAFGNAKTGRNDNSSRFGKFMELQFDKSGTITGAKIVNYMLEKSRIIGQSDTERNYHIFYMLCVGADADEQRDLSLRPPGTFRIVNDKSLTIPGKDDVEDFAELRQAFATCGVMMDEQADIFKSVAICLHVGDLLFKGDEESTVSNTDVLTTCAKLLGVDAEALNTALTKKKVSVGGSHVVKNLTPAQAEYARDALCKGLFNNLFDWIIVKINASVCKETSEGFIGLLDIFGFEIFEINSFEQFCINYTNEKLQCYFNTHMFMLERVEYDREGVPLDLIEFQDNTPCVELFELKPGGMISMLDEECTMPKATDLTWASKLYDKFDKKHAYFSKPRTSNSAFVVKHFAGDVTYEVTNFMDKNMDPLSDDILGCIKASSVGIFSELFATLFQEQEARSKGGRTKKMSVGTAFKSQLVALTTRLAETESFYVRTIKPNSIKSHNTFTTDMVLRQLQCSGVLEAMRIRRAGFPVRRTFQDFQDRYMILKPTAEAKDDTGRCEELIKAAGVADTDDAGRKQYTFGKTKVFMRERPYSVLEAAKENAYGKAAIVIQSRIRTINVTNLFKAKRQSSKFLSARIARIKPFNAFMGERVAAKQKVTFACKAAVARSRFVRIRHIRATVVQTIYRRHLAKIKYQKVRVEKLGEIEAQRRAEEDKKRREAEEAKRQEELRKAAEKREAELRAIKEEEERLAAALEKQKLAQLEEVRKAKEAEEAEERRAEEERHAKKEAEKAALRKAEMEEEQMLMAESDEAAVWAARQSESVEYARFARMASAVGGLPAQPPKAFPTKKGFLSKQGGGWKSWKQRFFVLDNNNLRYYKSNKENDLQGEIPLDGAEIGDGSKEAGKANCLKLVTPGRTYFMFADTAAEKEDWVAQLCNSLLFALVRAGKVPPNASTLPPTLSFPSASGWLMKEGGKTKERGKGKVQRRWFHLRESDLYYFKSPNDSFHSGVIPLNGVRVAAVEGSTKNELEIETTERTFVLTAKSPEEQADWVRDLQAAVKMTLKMERLRAKAAQLGSGAGAGGATMHARCEGFLHKRGVGNTDWKKRWFRLDGGKLCYFKNHKDSTPAGTIMMSNLSVSRADDEHGPCTLALMAPERHYVFKADTEKEINTWHDAIASYLDSVSGRAAKIQLPVKKGYCESRQAEGAAKWRKLYFWLKDFSLFCYKTKENGVPLVEIELEDCSIREYSGEGRTSAFELQNAAGSHLLSFETVEERDDWRKAIERHMEVYKDEPTLAAARKEARAKKTSAGIDGKREMEGMLDKMGPKGNWSQRYCVLIGLHLHYFKKQEDRVPAGSVSLEDAAVEPAEDRAGRRNALELFGPARNFYFVPELQADAARWEQAMRANQQHCLQSTMFVVEQEEVAHYPRRLVLAINENGIQVIKFGDEGAGLKIASAPKKDPQKEILDTYPFTNIFSWNATRTTFAFVVAEQKKRCTFKTSRGQEIASKVQKTAMSMFDKASRRPSRLHR